VALKTEALEALTTACWNHVFRADPTRVGAFALWDANGPDSTTTFRHLVKALVETKGDYAQAVPLAAFNQRVAQKLAEWASTKDPRAGNLKEAERNAQGCKRYTPAMQTKQSRETGAEMARFVTGWMRANENTGSTV
jgi:hypothetical protein